MNDKYRTKKQLMNDLKIASESIKELKITKKECNSIETSMKERETRYRTLIENIPQKIFLKDKNSVYISCNENLARDFNIKPKEIVGKTDYEFFSKKLADKYRRDDRRIMKSGKIEDIEERYTLNGKEYWVHTVKTPIRNENGEVTGILGIFWDITENKLREELLKENEEKFRMLSEQSLMGLVIVQDDRVKYVNQATTDITKYSKKEILNWKPNDFLKIFLPEERSFIIEQVKKKQDGNKNGVVPYYTIRIKTKNGKIKWIEQFSKTILFEGKPADFITLIDITERKHSEGKIKRHLELEKTAAEISELIVKTEDIDKGLNKALSVLGNIFKADQVYLFQRNKDKKIWFITHEWYKKGFKSHKKKLQNILEDKYLYWVEKLKKNKVISIPDTSKLTQKLLKDVHIILKQSISSILAIPLFYKDKFFGALAIVNVKKSKIWNKDEINILRTISEIITTSLLKDRFQKSLSKAIEELNYQKQRFEELAKLTIKSQEDERLYLASEIHDEFLQNLIATLYFIEKCDIPSKDKEMKEMKEKIISLIKASIDSGRRLISEIEPIKEPEIGLIQAIKKNINLRITDEKIKVRFIHPENPLKIAYETKINILRIIQEALINVQKHSKATKLDLKIKIKKNKLFIEIKDNGIGFNVKSILKSDDMHYGLLMMQERANLIGGNIILNSKIGKGTYIKGIFHYN
jgi:PAS domain S-box-containing protein